jgi:hydroxymethylbilane synthase
MTDIRIGTRRSPLALQQTQAVAALLQQRYPGLTLQVVPIETGGDRNTDAALSSLGVTGVFTREIEAALRSGVCDLAVHSMKDLATAMPDGLALGVVLQREDPRDAFISPFSTLSQLPSGAVVGTSSLRRRAMLGRLRPDVKVVNLRGNVHSRLRAAGIDIDGGRPPSRKLDGTFLALAGLRRLGLDGHATQLLDPSLFLPAPAQGAIAVQLREDDASLMDMVAFLDHGATRRAVTAERAFLQVMEGGCQLPLGALAQVEVDGNIHLSAMVLTLDGAEHVEGDERGTTPRSVGEALAHRLLAGGGDAILARVRDGLRQ